MAHKKSIPCYVPNGGVHNVVNIPMGIFVRAELKKLVAQLLKHHATLQTMVAAPATPRTLTLLRGLDAFLRFDLKPKTPRRMAKVLLTENEKNLKPTAREAGEVESFNFVTFAISCGLIAFIFLLASHLEYLESIS